MNRHNPLPLLLIAATVAVACLGAASTALAESPDMSRLDDERLVQAFWDCDARAVQEPLSAGDGALCAALSDHLKQRRFDGNFEQLLTWWQRHKQAEYAKRGVTLPEASADELALQAP
jgi:hypothetical protein